MSAQDLFAYSQARQQALPASALTQHPTCPSVCVTLEERLVLFNKFRSHELRAQLACSRNGLWSDVNFEDAERTKKSDTEMAMAYCPWDYPVSQNLGEFSV